MKLESPAYSASEDDNQIEICAVATSFSLFRLYFNVTLSIKSTGESSLEGLHNYYNNTKKF